MVQSDSPTFIRIRERQSELVSNEVFSELRKTDDFNLMLDQRLLNVRVRNDGFELEAGPFVGTIQISNRITLAIDEKAPGALDALISLAHGPEIRLLNASGHFHPRPQGSVSASWMQEAIWSLFLTEAKNYVLTQIESDYQQVVNFGSRPRGKILLKQTVRRAFAHGQRGRLYYRTHQLSRDTNLNQLIKYALSIIATAASNPNLHRLAISAGYLLFHLTDIRLNPEVRFAPAKQGAQPTELHKTLAELARAVIDDIIPLHAFATSLLFPLAAFIRLERLFEAAVFEVFRRACAAREGYYAHRYGARESPEYVLQDTKSFKAMPDIVVRGPGQILVDAKYRDFSKGVPHDALYQIIAHCDAFNVQEGLLVGLAEDAPPTQKLLGTTRSGIRISAVLVHPGKLEEQLQPAIHRAILRSEADNRLTD